MSNLSTIDKPLDIDIGSFGSRVYIGKASYGRFMMYMVAQAPDPMYLGTWLATWSNDPTGTQYDLHADEYVEVPFDEARDIAKQKNQKGLMLIDAPEPTFHFVE